MNVKSTQILNANPSTPSGNEADTSGTQRNETQGISTTTYGSVLWLKIQVCDRQGSREHHNTLNGHGEFDDHQHQEHGQQQMVAVNVQERN